MLLFETQIVRELCWRQCMRESWDSITVLCHSAVLLGVTGLCTACYSLIKQGPFSERVALSPKCKLAVREGLQLHDCALMLGSFYQGLKICAPQSKDCTRLSLLQGSSGYDNCHPQLVGYVQGQFLCSWNLTLAGLCLQSIDQSVSNIYDM